MADRAPTFADEAVGRGATTAEQAGPASPARRSIGAPPAITAPLTVLTIAAVVGWIGTSNVAGFLCWLIALVGGLVGG